MSKTNRVHVTNKQHMNYLLTKLPAWVKSQPTAESRLSASFWLGDLVNGTDEIEGLRALIAELKTTAVRELGAQGYSNGEIAEIVGCNRSRIQQLKQTMDEW